MHVLGAGAPAGGAGRTVSNTSYTYAHSITVDTLFDHTLRFKRVLGAVAPAGVAGA